MSRARAELHPERTALLFPTGGYHWPGMGADVEASDLRGVFDCVEAALAPFRVPPGSLPRLMAGADQARRDRDGTGWIWTGDFPLSMVAQMALGVALARSFIARYGPPRLLAGESMGELAAYCVAGALSLEETTALTYRWARDLQAASDLLGLRMAVIEDVEEGAMALLGPPLQANVVVTEAARLYVVALPPGGLEELEREAVRRGGHILVSNNPCAAHEPRLASAAEIWEDHMHFLAALRFAAPSIPLLSTLRPAEILAEPEALRKNRRDTTFLRVRWGDTLRALPGMGVSRLVQFGPASSGYAIKKLRSEGGPLAKVRLSVAATLAAVSELGAGRA
jgi:acyl transferase domain-containing protein